MSLSEPEPTAYKHPIKHSGQYCGADSAIYECVVPIPMEILQSTMEVAFCAGLTRNPKVGDILIVSHLHPGGEVTQSRLALLVCDYCEREGWMFNISEFGKRWCGCSIQPEE